MGVVEEKGDWIVGVLGGLRNEMRHWGKKQVSSEDIKEKSRKVELRSSPKAA